MLEPMKFIQILIIGTAAIYHANSSAEGTVSGMIHDEKNPVRGAEVMLIKSGSNQLVKSILTKKTGKYSFSAIKGIYYIKVFFEEYNDIKTNKISVDNQNIVMDIEIVPIGLEFN
jgi:hypothetical protein